MTRTGIVTDSTADLRPGVAARDAIEVVPLVVTWDSRTYRDKLDLTTSDFYQRLRKSTTQPTTAAPSPAGFEEAFRKQLARFDRVMCVTVAGKASATHAVALRAAELVDPGRVTVVDSQTISICLGWLVEAAAHWGRQGTPPERIVDYLVSMAARTRIYVVVTDLTFLQRGGRIGRAQALVGTLLDVKPILSISNGEAFPLERVRTFHNALQRLSELVGSLGPLERLGVVNGDAADEASTLTDLLTRQHPNVTVEQAELGSVLATHAGPGLVGVGVMCAPSVSP